MLNKLHVTCKPPWKSESAKATLQYEQHIITSFRIKRECVSFRSANFFANLKKNFDEEEGEEGDVESGKIFRKLRIFTRC